MRVSALFWILASGFRILLFVVVYDFGDDRERNFDDLAVGALDFDARRGQRLRHLHTVNDATYALAVGRDDLDIVFAVEGFQG